MKRDSRSASVQADAIEENVNQIEDVICTYCNGRFSDDVQGEVQVRCDMCEDWCAEECGGTHKDKFIRDYNVDIILDKKICPFLYLKLL
jgi:hypothetical protein